jgi:hypothetical protein
MIGSIIGGGIGLLSSMGNKSQNTTQDKSPWASAAPWMQQNIARGQQLQDFYAKNPFSQGQQTAYGNQAALGNSYRAMLPQLMSGLPTQQFNRANPAARAPMQSFAPPGGNLGFSPIQNQFDPSQMAPTQQAAPPPAYVAPPGQRRNWLDPLGINPGLFDPFGIAQGGQG